MAQQPKLDDRYTEGVWYDMMTGEYCRIVDTGDSIGLYEPEGSPETPYFTFDEEGLEKEDAIGKVNGDFRRVPEDAVRDPVGFLKDILDVAQTGGHEINPLTVDDEIGLGYAREQVTITED